MICFWGDSSEGDYEEATVGQCRTREERGGDHGGTKLERGGEINKGESLGVWLPLPVVSGEEKKLRIWRSKREPGGDEINKD